MNFPIKNRNLSEIFLAIQKEVRKWEQTHKIIDGLIQQLANFINKLSYLTIDRLDAVIDGLKQSKLIYSTSIDAEENLASLNFHLRESQSCLESIFQNIFVAEAQLAELQTSLPGEHSIDEHSCHAHIHINKCEEIRRHFFNKIPCEWSLVRDVAAQLQQQTSLNMCVAEKLKESIRNQEVDQDELVTIIACISYSPYVSLVEIGLFLDL